MQQKTRILQTIDKLISWLLLLIFPQITKAEVLPTDSLKISLLTCQPGQAIYALYGHTGIRVENKTQNTDNVYNYGLFDLQEKHFIWNFLLGKTDYCLGVIPFPYFCKEYFDRNSAIYSQALHLSQTEKYQLVKQLQLQLLPQNNVYRYNFLYKNCTTMARDQITKVLHQKINYPQEVALSKVIGTPTYRKIIHFYIKKYPWSEFGQDLLLGAEADKVITPQQQMFAPFFLLEYFAEAKLINKETSQKEILVSSTEVFKTKIWQKENESLTFEVYELFTPFNVWICFVLCTLYLVRKRKTFPRIYTCYNYLHLLLQGLVGCVVALLFFYSSHPTVNSNWLILFLNPIPIVFLLLSLLLSKNSLFAKIYYNFAFYITLLFLVAMPFLPQWFSSATYLWVINTIILTYIQKKDLNLSIHV